MASDYLGRALALTPESDIEERCEPLLAREGIDEAMGAHGERQHDLQALEVLRPALEKVDAQVEILLRQALCAGDMGQYEMADGTARQTGDRSREGMALGNLGFVAGLLGEYRLAMEYLEQSSQLNREGGQTLHVTYGLINLSACTGALGDFAAAESAANEANRLAQMIEDRSGEARALTYMGHSLLARGALSEATGAYSAALKIRRALEHLDLAAKPAAGLARAALAQGDLPGAWSCLKPVLAYLAGGGALEAADEPLRVYLAGFLVLEQDVFRPPVNWCLLRHSSAWVREAFFPMAERLPCFLSAV